MYTVNNGVEHDTIGTAVPVAGNPTAGARLVVDPFTVDEGRNVVRFQVTDAAGNDSPLYTVNVNVDQTPPNSTASVQPAENAAGWERVNTVVTFSGTDPAVYGRAVVGAVNEAIGWSLTSGTAADPDQLAGELCRIFGV